MQQQPYVQAPQVGRDGAFVEDNASVLGRDAQQRLSRNIKATVATRKHVVRMQGMLIESTQAKSFHTAAFLKKCALVFRPEDFLMVLEERSLAQGEECAWVLCKQQAEQRKLTASGPKLPPLARDSAKNRLLETLRTSTELEEKERAMQIAYCSPKCRANANLYMQQLLDEPLFFKEESEDGEDRTGDAQPDTRGERGPAVAEFESKQTKGLQMLGEVVDRVVPPSSSPPFSPSPLSQTASNAIEGYVPGSVKTMRPLSSTTSSSSTSSSSSAASRVPKLTTAKRTPPAIQPQPPVIASPQESPSERTARLERERSDPEFMFAMFDRQKKAAEERERQEKAHAARLAAKDEDDDNADGYEERRAMVREREEQQRADEEGEAFADAEAEQHHPITMEDLFRLSEADSALKFHVSHRMQVLSWLTRVCSGPKFKRGVLYQLRGKIGKQYHLSRSDADVREEVVMLRRRTLQRFLTPHVTQLAPVLGLQSAAGANHAMALVDLLLLETGVPSFHARQWKFAAIIILELVSIRMHHKSADKKETPISSERSATDEFDMSHRALMLSVSEEYEAVLAAIDVSHAHVKAAVDTIML
jgi:hypothetical protein